MFSGLRKRRPESQHPLYHRLLNAGYCSVAVHRPSLVHCCLRYGMDQSIDRGYLKRVHSVLRIDLVASVIAIAIVDPLAMSAQPDAHLPTASLVLTKRSTSPAYRFVLRLLLILTRCSPDSFIQRHSRNGNLGFPYFDRDAKAELYFVNRRYTSG